MKKNDNFNFFVGVDIDEDIYKSAYQSDDDKRYDKMEIWGLASDNSKDVEGQILEPSGYEIDDFLKSGLINLEHYTSRKGSSKYWIGEPIDAKIKGNEFYVKAKLWKAHPEARNFWDTLLIMKSSGSTRKAGFSIEGTSKEKDPTNKNRITKAKINHCAVTLSPVNKNSWLDIVKGQQKEDFIQPEVNINSKYAYEFEKGNKKYGVTKDFRIEEILDEKKMAISNIIKSMNNNIISFDVAKKMIKKFL